MNALNTLLLTSMVTMTLLMVVGVILMRRQNQIAGPIFVIIFWLAVLSEIGFIVRIVRIVR